MYAAITGWGTALPPRVVSNTELAATIGADAAWIEQRTGIIERRHANPGETTATLAARAGRSALSAAGVQARDLDLVVVATMTPDQPCPPTAPLVQHALGATAAGAFDVNAACAGFLSALAAASAMVRTGGAMRALVIGAEVMSRVVDPADAKTFVLFGDGAGAAVIESSQEQSGLMWTTLGADGSGSHLIGIPAGGSAMPTTAGTVAANAHVLSMDGPEVFRAAVRTMVAASGRALMMGDLRPRNIDLFVCHQANLRIIRACAEKLGIPPERVYSNVERYGNTSAASIPLALAEAGSEGLLRDGSTVLIAAVGAGLTWGAGVLSWTAARGIQAGARAREAVR